MNLGLRDITYGMYIIASKSNDQLAGCVINTCNQVTSEDNIIAINVNKNNYTNQIIRESKTFSLAILEEDAPKDLITNFGYKTSKDFNKFANINYEIVNDIPIIKEGVTSYLICEVVDIIDVNTHDIFLAKVVDGEKINDHTPMTYKYYHEVFKGSSPKNAPTYVESTTNDTEAYVCEICGYVHEGPMPDDFVCPVCGVDKTNFKKIR